MSTTLTNTSLKRVTGGLFALSALAFAAAATTLSATFDWPDILREPASVVLPAFAAGGAGLVWTWFALLGEHLGQLLVIAWSVSLSAIILRRRILPQWLGATGLVASALYLLNQGDVLATAIPGFPVWDLAGLLGSTSWGLWVAALGICILVLPAHAKSLPAAKSAETISATTPTKSTPL